MTEVTRRVVFALGALAVGLLLIGCFADLPSFGTTHHLGRDLAIPAMVQHAAANAVATVNFDLRAFDTMGEESILIASVVAVSALLRPTEDEWKAMPRESAQVRQVTLLAGYVLLPLLTIVGLDVVVHGHLTPGGGFQGGVLLATALYVLYITGGYQALDRLRPLEAYETADAVGTAAFAVLGIAGLVVSGSFLVNLLPWGTLGQLPSSGTVFFLNVAVGVAVAGGLVVVLARFLDQDIVFSRGD